MDPWTYILGAAALAAGTLLFFYSIRLFNGRKAVIDDADEPR